MAYSLYETVQDHTVTAQRWFHRFGVKLGFQHVLPTFILFCATQDLWTSAMLGGPFIYAGILFYKAHGSTKKPNWLDWIHDGAIAILPVAFSFLATRNWPFFALTMGYCLTVLIGLSHNDNVYP